jgi:hypothetical protein
MTSRCTEDTKVPAGPTTLDSDRAASEDRTFEVPMGVLLWLLIPLAALIVGIVSAYLIGRPARPAAMQDSMDSFSRFRHALAARHTAGRPPGHPPGSREPVPQVQVTQSPAIVAKDPPTRSE